ncbi:MAG: nucleotidyltransferase domain-containing protein [Desulfuromonadaceae bacterium]
MKSKPDIPVIDLNRRDWREVKRILAQYVPEHAVWAFGSRVSGPAKTYSDLDIVIITDQPLSLERMATIRDAFDESDLPIRVDVVDWAATSASFREIIRRNYVVIQEGNVS